MPANAVGVVVVGETPYAEGFGDVGGPQWAYDPGDHGRAAAAEDHAARRRGHRGRRQGLRAGREVHGGRGLRPADDHPAGQLLDSIDALVASWLPGSEGEGVADVLFGNKPFTGKLPGDLAAHGRQEPINVGDASYDPLYPYGFGLGT